MSKKEKGQSKKSIPGPVDPNAILKKLTVQGKSSRRASVSNGGLGATLRPDSEYRAVSKMQLDHEATLPEWYEDLTDDNLGAFKDLFDMLDSGNTGLLTVDNMYEALKKVDPEMTYGEVESVLKKLDKDGNGEIDFDEFLFHMTQMGEDLFSTDNDGKGKYSKRQRLFYTAITQFSVKQTLEAIRQKYPHVLMHYTAGARTIGLTDREITREMKRLKSRFKHNDSPYAKPLSFVPTAGSVKKIKRRRPRSTVSPSKTVTAAHPVSSKIGKGGSSCIVDVEEPPIPQVPDINQEIQESLRLLAQRGSIVAKIPDAHLIMGLRQKFGSVTTAWRRGSGAGGRRISIDRTSYSDSKPLVPIIPEVPPQELLPPVAEGIQRKPSQRKKEKKFKRPSHPIKGWVVPRCEYYNVPVPDLKVKIKAKRPTYEDLPNIREKAKEATQLYYTKLRKAMVAHAWEHWDKIYAHLIKPDKLLENFRIVYRAYSPHKEEEAFVLCPWKPGPFTQFQRCSSVPVHEENLITDVTGTYARTQQSKRKFSYIVRRPYSSLN